MSNEQKGLIMLAVAIACLAIACVANTISIIRINRDGDKNLQLWTSQVKLDEKFGSYLK